VAQGTLSDPDRVNQPVWSRDATIFLGQDAWTDKGERNALHAIADEVRDGHVLDIGVGTGRTTWHLHLLSHQYVAIDYTPEMVELCRASYPGVDARTGDVRDLSDFEDGSFDLVVFSCNGIDALSHEDRAVALAEIHRVLRPGGIFFFSTLNRLGPLFHETPRQHLTPSARTLRGRARWLADTPRRRRQLRMWTRNWERLTRLEDDHQSWAVAPLSAHDFGLLTHYITPDGEADELGAHDFSIEHMFAPSGVEFSTQDPPDSLAHFHVVARSSRSST